MSRGAKFYPGVPPRYLSSGSGKEADLRPSRLEAEQLADIVRTLVVRLGRYDGAAGETYDRLCALIKRRNIVVHSPWSIGWASPGETTDAASVQAFSLNRKLKGSAVDVRELHFSELQRDIAEAQAVRARLHKLLALAVLFDPARHREMARKSTGNVRKHSRGYSARIRIGPERPSLVRPRPRRRGRGGAGRAPGRPREAPASRRSAAEIRFVLDAAGNARTERLERGEGRREDHREGRPRRPRARWLPPSTFAKEWTSGELRKKHPDHVREKDSTRDEQVLRDYINPLIGPTQIPDVTLETRRTGHGAPAVGARAANPQAHRAVHAEGALPGRLPGPPHREQPDPPRVDAEDSEEREQGEGVPLARGGREAL